MAKSQLAKSKEKAWRAFSKYIRIRDALLTTGTTDYAICCTCGKEYPIAKLQAGHYLPGRTNGILFDERGVHAQCVGCNMFGKGMQAEYHLYMLDKYGAEVCEELARQKVSGCKIRNDEYDSLAVEYNRRAAAMMANEVVDPSWAEPFIDALKRAVNF